MPTNWFQRIQLYYMFIAHRMAAQLPHESIIHWIELYIFSLENPNNFLLSFSMKLMIRQCNGELSGKCISFPFLLVLDWIIDLENSAIIIIISFWEQSFSLAGACNSFVECWNNARTLLRVFEWIRKLKTPLHWSTVQIVCFFSRADEIILNYYFLSFPSSTFTRRLYWILLI